MGSYIIKIQQQVLVYLPHSKGVLTLNEPKPIRILIPHTCVKYNPIPYQ